VVTKWTAPYVNGDPGRLWFFLKSLVHPLPFNCFSQNIQGISRVCLGQVSGSINSHRGNTDEKTRLQAWCSVGSLPACLRVATMWRAHCHRQVGTTRDKQKGWEQSSITFLFLCSEFILRVGKTINDRTDSIPYSQILFSLSKFRVSSEASNLVENWSQCDVDDRHYSKFQISGPALWQVPSCTLASFLLPFVGRLVTSLGAPAFHKIQLFSHLRPEIEFWAKLANKNNPELSANQ
jgi:hypothetical protein